MSGIEAEARASSERDREQVRHKALVEAEKCKSRALSAVAIEARRLEQAHIESLLDSICQEIRGRIEQGPGDKMRASIASLCAQAIRGMKADRYVVRLSPEIHLAVKDVFYRDLREELGRDLPSLTLVGDPETAGFGVVVEAGDGTQVWDNRLVARFSRLWPQLSLQIAKEAGLVGSTEETEDRP